MGAQVSQQMLVFCQSILLGLSAGVLYDLLRPFRLRFPRFTGALDTAYCLAVGGAAFRFLLRRCGGELRGFAVLGALGGAVLFFCALSQPLRPVWDFWADTGLLGAFAVLSPAAAEKFLQKNGPARKKSLLFCGKMLYNKKNRASDSLQRRRQRWQKRRPREKGPATAPAF